MSSTKETLSFQTEARQLLDLMVHSIYSNKDIFLRELISNASDALDKRRFAALTRAELLPSGTELEIRLEVDDEKRVLSVSDNGIGMTRDEVIGLIGTIARSGTKEFLAELRQAKAKELPPELIGQFGVGFYSAFMAAKRVRLLTRKAGEEAATLWESSGDGTYTVEEAERPEPGTTVTLELKEADSEDGLHDYADELVIRRIVKRYSDFVAYPIRMEIEAPAEDEDESKGKGKDRSAATATRLETLNSMKAIWTRDPATVSDDEFKEFYKHIAHDWNDPLERIAFKIEGTLEYRALLFIPSVAPFDLFSRESHRGVHLYVKRVFILDECRDLVPEYLRFVRGVVDSEDLSLNISREMLQQDRQIQRMRKGLVKKVLETLAAMKAERAETYEKFWKELGRVLKEGLYQDYENREALLGLVLCESTWDPSKLTDLAGYVSRMKEGQDTIYFMTGESRAAVEASPHLERLLDEGYEVLILIDPVDDVWTQQIAEHDGKKLQSVGKGTVDLEGEADKKAREAKSKDFADILEYIKDRLSEHVKEVRVSSRLKSSPSCLVGDAHDLSPQLEALLRAHNQEVPSTKRILEVNAEHPILARMQGIFAANRTSPLLADYAYLLHGQALIAEGGRPTDPARFSRLVADLMVKAAG